MASAKARIWGSLAASGLCLALVLWQGARMMGWSRPSVVALSQTSPTTLGVKPEMMHTAEPVPKATAAEMRTTSVVQNGSERRLAADAAALTAGAQGLVAIKRTKLGPDGHDKAFIERQTPWGVQGCEVETAWGPPSGVHPSAPFVVSMKCESPKGLVAAVSELADKKK